MNEFNFSFLRNVFVRKIHINLLILSILIQAFGTICAKYAAENTISSEVYGLNTTIIFIFIILAAMGLQVIVWQYALKYYPLSFAYPFKSLVSFVVLLSAFFLFNESITLLNIVGLTIITVGVFYLVHDKEIYS